MCGWFSEARACASRSKRATRSGSRAEAPETIRIGREDRGKNLDRDLAMQLGVAGAIDYAHTANAERADDLVRADVCAGRQPHEVIGAAAAGDGGRPAGLYRSRVDIRLEASSAARSWQQLATYYFVRF